MKKLIIAVTFLLVFAYPLHAAQFPSQPVSTCQVQSPFGWPQTTKPGTIICHHAYITYVDNAAKIPIWVSYTLVPDHAVGCLPRTNAFAADANIPNGATPQDYVGTNFDKGHNAPDGDMEFDAQAQSESFLMTNMSPQAPSLNRGIWKLLETTVRAWALELNQPMTVYVGNLYSPGDTTIGKGVVVPHALYKIVINDTTHQVAAWMFPHVAPYPNLGNDLTKFRVPVSKIQLLAGVTFAFPPGVTELQPGTEWPVNFKVLTAAKHQKCGSSSTTE